MISMIFSDGMQGVHQEEMPDAKNWRDAATMARKKLARYGTVRREHNMPGGTDRLWVAAGNRAVHAIEK